MKHSLSLALALGTVLLGGCNTFERRAQEKSAAYQALAPAQQEKLRQGVIELGNSPDLVYIALGAPNARHEKASAAGRETTWVYRTYYRDYEGPAFAGYRRTVVYDPQSRRYFVYQQPVYADVYSEQEEETIRVKFRDDRVVEIEQPVRRS